MMNYIKHIAGMLSNGKDSMDVMGFINNNPAIRKTMASFINKNILLSIATGVPTTSIAKIQRFTGLDLDKSTRLFNCIKELEGFIKGL